MPLTMPTNQKSPTLARYLVILAVYILIQLSVVYAFKLDTLGALLNHHWQIADLRELAAEPLTSWIYVHSQPPLLNIIISIFSSINGEIYLDFILLNCFCAAGAAVVVKYVVNEFLFLSEWLGYCVSLAYLLAPGTLLNTGYPFYPALTSAGYSVLALSLFLNKSHKSISLILLTGSVIYLTLLRSSFAPLVAIAIFLVYFIIIDNRASSRRNILIVVIISLTPITAVDTKNYIMYDFWGSTSWAPLNMAKGFGSLAEFNYFPSPAQIKNEMPNITCVHGYRTIDTSELKSDGNPNYNSCYFLSFAQSQRSDLSSRYDIKQHLRRVISHFGKYYSLPDKYEYLSNRSNIESYANAYDKIFLPLELRKNYNVRISILILMILTAYQLVKQPNKCIFGLYLICLIHLFSHVLTDGDEGDRFVFDIEFSFYIFGAYLFASFAKKVPQFT